LRPPFTPSSDGVSSSLELSASFRVLRPARRPSCLVEPRAPTERPKSASHGVPLPHRDISRRRPPLRGASRPSGHVPSSPSLTSSGGAPRAPWECLHIPSALGLGREEPLAAGPRRLTVARMGLPGFRLPTRSSFLT